MTEQFHTRRRYKDGDSKHLEWSEHMVTGGISYRCPTYVHRTPPCQANCPSGHDVRGWLNIVRGLVKPASDIPWQEHAFRLMTEANPFPAIMGRVCPAPCQDSCNRSEVEDHVGINSIEQYIGNWAIERKVTFAKPHLETGKKVAIVGGGPAGLAAAYILRKMGHGCTIFEEHAELGGMMRYGIPSYRTPRNVIDAEIRRIVDMGVEVRLNTRVGSDVTVEQIEKGFDAIFWGIGAQAGKSLRIPGFDEATNCVSGIAFLRAFNEGRLQGLHGRLLVIGGGDTAMDVASVARRIGHIGEIHNKDLPESVILGLTDHDDTLAAKREDADVWIVYRRPISKAPAAKHEINACIGEGVEIHDQMAPLEIVLGDDNRAKGLKVIKTDWSSGEMVTIEGTEEVIEATLIVNATGQAVKFEGYEDLDNGNGLIHADHGYAVPGKPGQFVGGDAINPHLLTTAIGHAWKACLSIDEFMSGKPTPKRAKVHVHHFNLLDNMKEAGLMTEEYPGGQVSGTSEAKFAVHNYEDRSFNDIILAGDLFLGHFPDEERKKRDEVFIDPDDVLNNFEERMVALTEKEVIAEANRCMSCGLCFECDSCVIYCPQGAIHRVPKGESTMGRYVNIESSKCVGCEICMDVCPTGYIQMGLGKA